MTFRVTVVDYKLGNLKSITNAFHYLGANVLVTGDPHQVESADYLVVPGVGAFGTGMTNLRRSGLDEAICNYALRQRPLLGICLGFQMFCLSSEEFGYHEGLKLFHAFVKRIPGKVRLPHVGWSCLELEANKVPKLGLQNVNPYYFIHSYCVLDATCVDRTFWASYAGTRFIAACSKGNLFGVQFHPEKSGIQGLNVLREFLKS